MTRVRSSPQPSNRVDARGGRGPVSRFTRSPRERHASGGLRRRVGGANRAAPTSAATSTCIRCINKFPLDDGRCPVHAECDEGTCRTHTPKWRRFCSHTMLSDEQRATMRRWIKDVAPATESVDEMSDEQLCDVLKRLDAEWRRPLLEPESFSCDEEDAISYEPFSDVPHELIGTFEMPSSSPDQARLKRCADIRGVEQWWRTQPRERRTVPQFHHLDNQPYFQGLMREWEGRIRFANEQFAPDVVDYVGQLRSPDGPMAIKASAVKRLGVLALQSDARREIAAARGIGPIVALLECGDDQIETDAAVAIANLSFEAAYRTPIADAKAIAPLAALLRRGTAEGKVNASLALAHISKVEAHQREIADSSVFVPLVAMLQQDDVRGDFEINEWYLYPVDVLANLAVDVSHRGSIVAAEAIEPLVALLRLGMHSKVVERAASALGFLTKDSANLDEVVSANAIDPLVAQLRYVNRESSALSARVLANLAMDEAHRATIASTTAIASLVEMLKHGGESGRIISALALANLALDDANREAIVSADAVGPLFALWSDGHPFGKLSAKRALERLNFQGLLPE